MSTTLFKFEIGTAVELTPLRKVRGKYGAQWIANIKGKEYFLPSHQRLIMCLEQNKKVSITLIAHGNRYKETDYRIHQVQKSLDDF